MATECWSAADAAHMRRALRLAERGCTAPNPMVGCVIVAGDAVVGEGYHVAAGEPHAEAVALRAAGGAARGATAYVTLEPCAHPGLADRCAPALVAAGVKRVVIAVEDPDERTTGRGTRLLQRAAVQVETGLLGGPAARLNEGFFHYAATGRPFVTLKYAMTLDGKIATRTGASRWITGIRARGEAHRLRRHSGAVMVGLGTVLADDPLLLPAKGPCTGRAPLRVVVDSSLRVPVSSQLVATASTAAPVLVACCRPLAARVAELLRPGLTIATLPEGGDRRVDVSALLVHLGELRVTSVLCEGGAALAAALLESGEVHRIAAFVAPTVFGGSAAPGPVAGDGAALPADALRLAEVEVRRYRPDVYITGRVDTARRQTGDA